ncbi:sigma-70 family RNA polymerase sigma factor [Alteromonadaceae bacterium M269]|nr:sigma-70 family RNA polymerase sigma factor [Alteromonadaceae bacterium M269]
MAKLKAVDSLLVLSAQQGSKAAFEELFGRYQSSLLGFAMKLANDLELAQDATQETWLHIAKSLPKLKEPRAFKAWLFKSLRWRLADIQRKHKDSETLKEEHMKDAVTGQLDREVDSSNALYLGLTELDKQCIHLFYLEQMTVVEVSAVLDVPAGTVKSRLYRARNKIKQNLSEENDDGY